MRQRTFALILITLVLLVGAGPVIRLFAEALSHAGKSAMQLYSDTGTAKSFLNSLLLALTVAAAVTPAGTALGILIGKTDLPLRKLFALLLIVPLLLPPYILALGWVNLIGTHSALSDALFGFAGTAWVLFGVYLPIPVLLTLLFLRRIDPHFEEAACFFTDEGGILRFITLPLLRPAMSLSFLLVFILAFGEYSVADTLRYAVFPLETFTQFSAFYDFDAAVLMSVPMLLVALAILVLQLRSGGRIVAAQGSRFPVRRLALSKRRKRFYTLLTASGIFVIVFLPLIGLVAKIDGWHRFREALSLSLIPLAHSVAFALAGAFALTVLGFFGGYILAYRLTFFNRLFDAVLLWLFILPPTVVGIALILFFNTPALDIVYTTPLIIVVGIGVKYLFLPTKILQTSLLHLPSAYCEAAELLGADWRARLRHIVIPLSRRALAAAFAVGYLFSLRETAITLLVHPPGDATLPVAIMTRMANGHPAVTASLCVIMVLATLLPLLPFAFGRKKETV